METIIDTLITDRTQADVERARYLNGLWDPQGPQWRGTPQELAEWKAGPRGAYGFTDMNRVTQAASYLIGELERLGYSVDIENAVPAYYIRIETDPAGGGSASGAGVFYRGKTVTVTAQPGEKYNFEGWTEAGSVVSPDNVYTFTAERSRTLTAAFSLKKFRVDAAVDPPGTGEVTGAGTYDIDTQVTVVAAAGNGYAFTRWTEGGETVWEGPQYTFTLNRDRALFALMTKTHVISVTANDGDGGTVSGSGTYLDGQTVTVAAVAGDGYEFAGWSENGTVVSTEETYSFEAVADRGLVAVFVKIYVVTLLADPAESGTVLGGGVYREGAKASISATAGEGYRFVSWQSGGEQVSTSNPYAFTVSGDQTLTALFEEIPVYTITVSIDPEESGTVTGAGRYQEGAAVTLTATVNGGYIFTGWQENGAVVSTDNPYTFTAEGDRAFVVTPLSRLPEGYTEVEYVEATASSIATQIKPTETTKITMDVETLDSNPSSSQEFFFSYYYSSSSGDTYHFDIVLTASGIKGNMGWKSPVGSQLTTIDSSTTPRRMIVGADCSLKKEFVGNKEVFFKNNSADVKMPAITLLSNGFNKYFLHGKLYSCQMEDNGIPVRDFVPCVNPSGVAGLYDLVSETFFGSTTTTPLTPGPAV